MVFTTSLPGTCNCTSVTPRVYIAKSHGGMVACMAKPSIFRVFENQHVSNPSMELQAENHGRGFFQAWCAQHTVSKKAQRSCAARWNSLSSSWRTN